MYYLISFLLGLLAVWPLLLWVHRRSPRGRIRVLAVSLLLAALVYPGFALVWGDASWFGIEVAGVFLYGLMAWLGWRVAPLWLALGWLLHPLWDVFLHLLGPGAHIAPAWYAVACVSFDIAVAVYIVCAETESPRQGFPAR